MLFAIGADTPAGARGRDNFLYRSAADGGDTIQDFVVAVDTLQFSASAFVGLTANAPLGAGQFISGASPTAAGTATFLYDTTLQDLSWDADGVAGGAVLIAHFDTAVALTANDFRILA